MPKKRPLATVSNTIDEKIEQFASQADNDSPKSIELDPNAKRDFKEIRLPLNEYEFNLLDTAAKNSGRSRLNFIRWAITRSCT